MARLNYRQIRDALALREPFQGNSMWAEYARGPQSIQRGRLSELDVEWMREDARKAERDLHPFYVVYSYGTPIAWAYGDTVCVPDTKYSRTTSAQQGLARSALA